ncbi:MAG: hypothetical protein ACJ790_07405 [Myxococcaceae bacterium]
MSARKWLLLGAGCALAIVACTVSLPDDAKYKCDSDKDCGTDFVCVHPSDSLPYCCRNGSECAPIDAGTGGGGGGGGACSGVDLQTDSNNCGTCGNVCASTDKCSAGNCVPRGEIACSDGQDNDGDGQADCADSDCQGLSCGLGCTCKAGVKTETTCFGGVDEDGDGQTDCADSDCVNQSCGQGCACVAGGGKVETSCTDGLDNDGDGNKDCADTADCVNGAQCKPNPNTSTCSAGACTCNGAPAPNGELRPDGGRACNDGIDNDCSGATDCADTSCGSANCSTDGGQSCICRNLQKSENNCANKADDDGDGLIDCADQLPDGGGDCPIGIACRKPNNQLGMCQANQNCQ